MIALAQPENMRKLMSLGGTELDLSPPDRLGGNKESSVMVLSHLRVPRSEGARRAAPGSASFEDRLRLLPEPLHQRAPLAALQPGELLQEIPLLGV